MFVPFGWKDEMKFKRLNHFQKASKGRDRERKWDDRERKIDREREKEEWGSEWERERGREGRRRQI
jgi:hypothetical protein